MGRIILKIVQVLKSELSEELYTFLDSEKSFTDCDKNLNEIIVCTGVLADVSENNLSEKVVSEAKSLFDETKKYNYIQI